MTAPALRYEVRSVVAGSREVVARIADVTVAASVAAAYRVGQAQAVAEQRYPALVRSVAQPSVELYDRETRRLL